MRLTLLLILMSVLLLFACTSAGNMPLKIGVIIPLSGDGAVYGEWSQKALEIAKDELNIQGGINGRPIELLYEDGKFKAPESVHCIS